MAFYRLDNPAAEIALSSIREDAPTVGYLSSAELAEVSGRFGFFPETVQACERANPMFRTGAEVYHQYTFTELRIVNEEGEDDWIALFLKRNLLLVVDILDRDGSTRACFQSALGRTPDSVERLLCCFLEKLLDGGTASVEKMRNTITDMEEEIVTGRADDGFSTRLLEIKKRLLKLYNYYDQILDVANTLEENENSVFSAEKLDHLTGLNGRVTRLRGDMDSLSGATDHLQDAFSSYMDAKLNHQMKILTVITTAFFPLTIIVGWYGMNFESMPEFKWRFGYLYVILLSVVVVAALVAVAKKKKWF